VKRYINFKGCQGVETIDELDARDFGSMKEFRIKLRRLINEYVMSGHDVYISSRCTKEWRD
jgi:hypothetical protein